jgi:hypothetical protein
MSFVAGASPLYYSSPADSEFSTNNQYTDLVTKISTKMAPLASTAALAVTETVNS